jgi:hypothetical protein
VSPTRGYALVLVAAAIATAAVPATATGQEEVAGDLGYVSHVEGIWLLAGDTVRLYRRVLEGDSLSVILPAADAFSDATPSLAVVAMSGQRVRFLCDVAEACRGPLVPADSVERSSELLAFAGRVVRAVSSLVERENPEVVSTISRGGPAIREAVVSSHDGTLDLEPLMDDPSAGRYRLELTRLGGKGEADAASDNSAGLVWDPTTGTSIEAPGVEPGLYQVEVSATSGLFSRTSMAWILVAEAGEASQLQRRLAEAVEITESWPEDRSESEVRTFLRMYLQHLGDLESVTGG